MPEHISTANKDHVQEIREYYQAVHGLLKVIKYWPDISLELDEFLDRGGPKIGEMPSPYKDFCRAWQKVYDASNKLGLEQNISDRKLRALARGLYHSYGRQQFYHRFLQGRIDCVSDCNEPVSVIEIEERYLYYLHRKESHVKGKGIGPRFDVWIKENGHPTTFYTILASS